ncbi:disease resistance protein At4g27190-like isoform X2 [Magnolia sinica]|uniref:disease resistance protein At4g27190-like isoform X2 n=1 Tax=Magnolia sinica TaxID=86752 RepID=UPI00265B4393|nr:disease resistance protein At4g27190-like isoform X2 [Magnolia sinica]XP_058105981.1 disease resistance protein At4g27190-like isoform X2 [Magnolia sinica]XP_058105982.1 disease resistance protein At4g27190-like isoform X2 [Magnolia sinica]
MELLSPVVDIVLFFVKPVSRFCVKPVYQRIRYLTHLNNNVETLKQEKEELQNKRNEIQADVNHAVSVGKRRIPVVENWLTEVSKIETEVDPMILEFEERRTCFNGCCTDYFSRYKLGKRVVKKLEDVKNLKVKGAFGEVAESPRPVPERQPSIPRGQQNTFNKTKEEILQCLRDEENGVVGVYGMGGIGKTTLMGAINDSLIRTGEFGVVIWVTVSKDLNLGLIQEQIGKKLEIRFDSNEDMEEKRHKLYARLKNVNYLLILDDLWEKISLKQVGIPKPDKINRCKIAITTRSFAVCNDMDVDKAIKVGALTEEEAWNFFCETCGDVAQSSEIRTVAEEVVKECGGLPLAIKTVGGAMKRKDRKELWEDALRALKGSSPEVPGMERQVFLPLKLSYDYLENEEIKSCFLYCSLFPEDYHIPIDWLVRYWATEEGFIKNVNNLEEASNKVHRILERIKDACLLDKGHLIATFSNYDDTVKMHDLLRDLAIWITSQLSSSSKDGSKFFVKTGEGLVQPPEEKMWGGMVRISLMRNKIEHLQITPDCPHLVSLFLNDNYQLRTIHGGFFELMPNLQILDLSYTCIESLPVSLSLLMNLRALVLTNCRHLVEVSQLGKLEELQLLDLSGSGLKSLPQGIASLIKLKWLDLSSMEDLIPNIPWDMIFGLPSLEVLRMMELKHVDGATFSKAATMTRLTSLRIQLYHLNGFIAHDMFHRWFSGLRRFHVQGEYQKRKGFESFVLETGKHISIRGCDNFPCGIEGLIKHATSLRLENCKGLTDLSKFQGDLKSLTYLQVIKCSGVECIIDCREVGDDVFQCLQWLSLSDLPNLEKVFDGGAPQPNTRLQNLRKIYVFRCPKIRCLFSSNMVEYLHQLEEIRVQFCYEMEEIIEGDMLPHNSFPRLRILQLAGLSKLVSICRQRLIFKSLEEMEVTYCPMLKKLPLFSSSIHQIKGEIEGEREWWEGLEWEDENTKSLCSTIYNLQRSFLIEKEYFPG